MLRHDQFVAGIAARPAIAVADTITLNSDLINESNNITGTNVKITWLHPEWEPNGVNYFWISYADTGYPPGDIPHATWPDNASIPGDPTAVFLESFVLPYQNNTGSITVWADDTASVWIGSDNSWTLLKEANPVQGLYCFGVFIYSVLSNCA